MSVLALGKGLSQFSLLLRKCFIIMIGINKDETMQLQKNGMLMPFRKFNWKLSWKRREYNIKWGIQSPEKKENIIACQTSVQVHVAFMIQRKWDRDDI